MKKILTLLGIACLLSSSAQTAFEENGHHVTLGYGFPNLYKSILKTSIDNQQQVNTAYGMSFNSSTTYKTTGLGPLFFKYEYGLTDHIGLGAVIGYFSAGLEETFNYQESYYNGGKTITNNYTDVTKFTIKSLSVGARFNYHFGSKKALDPYIGFAAGYTRASIDLTTETDNPNSFNNSRFTITDPIPLYLGLTFGLRYYFSDNIGLYGEFGLDKWAVIQGGLAFKFK